MREVIIFFLLRTSGLLFSLRSGGRKDRYPKILNRPIGEKIFLFFHGLQGAGFLPHSGKTEDALDGDLPSACCLSPG
jgi:hypothetical protein